MIILMLFILLMADANQWKIPSWCWLILAAEGCQALIAGIMALCKFFWH